MSITVTPHKNTIFFYLLLNLVGYDKETKYPKHPLRERIESDWKNKALPSMFADFLEFYENKDHPLHIYNFTQWALFNDDNLEPLSDLEDSTYQPFANNTYSTAKNVIQSLSNSMGFEEYYQSILPEYTRYSLEISTLIEEKGVLEKIKSFWQTDLNFDFTLILNPLMEARRGNAARYKSTVFTVLGPTIKVNTDVYEFSKSELWQKLVHEFSHLYLESFISKYVEGLGTDALLDFNNKLSKVKTYIDNLGEFPIVKASYRPARTYFEETIIRGLTPLAMMPFAANKTPEELEEINQKALTQLAAMGFPFAKDVYETIKSARLADPSASLELLFKQILDNLADKA